MSLDEWDVANSLRDDEAAAAAEHRQAGATAAADDVVVPYPAVLEHFTGIDLSHRRKELSATLPEKPGFFAGLMGMSSELEQQRLQLIALAELPYTEDDPWSWKLLASTFTALTGSSSIPGRFGSHWEQLGFQGNDPATDLRGSGMLGLLHLYLLHHHDPANAARLLRLSRSSTQEFPLAIVSFNVTVWVLQMVRQGQLSALASSCKSLVQAAGHVYIGTMYEFYNAWQSGNKTMADSGFVLKALEVRAMKWPGDMARAAEKQLSD